MPDGSRSDLPTPADVIMIFCEDDAANTVRPRLDVAGADVARVHQLIGTRDPDKEGIRLFCLSDVITLREALEATGARLVVIDPFAAHIGGKDSHRDEQMRMLLTPLAELARRYSAAIMIVRHLRKSGGQAATAGAGTVGITGAARSVLLVGKDLDDPDARVLAVSKGNLAAPAESLSFTVDTIPVALPDPEGVMRDTPIPRIAWGEATDATAEDLIGAARADAAEGTATKDTEAVILETLADMPITADELKRAVINAASTSERSFERARAKLTKARKIWKHKGPGLLAAWWWGTGEAPPVEWLADRAKWGSA